MASSLAVEATLDHNFANEAFQCSLIKISTIHSDDFKTQPYGSAFIAICTLTGSHFASRLPYEPDFLTFTSRSVCRDFAALIDSLAVTAGDSTKDLDVCNSGGLAAKELRRKVGTNGGLQGMHGR